MLEVSEVHLFRSSIVGLEYPHIRKKGPCEVKGCEPLLERVLVRLCHVWANIAMFWSILIFILGGATSLKPMSTGIAGTMRQQPKIAKN